MEHYKNLVLENIIETIDGILYEENWKGIIGYENYYRVSSFGRIKALSIRKKRGRFYHTQSEKIVKIRPGSRGYVKVHLCVNGKRKDFNVHRLVATAFVENPGNKEQVNHIDGVKTNNFYKNLEWNTPLQNIHHAMSTGLADNNGEKGGLSKLKNADVLFIRESNLSYSVLSKKFGVYISTIQKIRSRHTWKHI